MKNRVTFRGKTFPCPSFPCVFLGIPCFFPLRGSPCFFERFSLLFQGFQGFGRDKKSLFFCGGFSCVFFQKKKERKDRVPPANKALNLSGRISGKSPENLFGNFVSNFALFAEASFSRSAMLTKWGDTKSVHLLTSNLLLHLEDGLVSRAMQVPQHFPQSTLAAVTQAS